MGCTFSEGVTLNILLMFIISLTRKAPSLLVLHDKTDNNRKSERIGTAKTCT